MFTVQENLEELATLESLDNGKPYIIAKTVDVPMASHSPPTLHAETGIPMLIMFEWGGILCWTGDSSCTSLTVWQSHLYEAEHAKVHITSPRLPETGFQRAVY